MRVVVDKVPEIAFKPPPAALKKARRAAYFC